MEDFGVTWQGDGLWNP